MKKIIVLMLTLCLLCSFALASEAFFTPVTFIDQYNRTVKTLCGDLEETQGAQKAEEICSSLTLYYNETVSMDSGGEVIYYDSADNSIECAFIYADETGGKSSRVNSINLWVGCDDVDTEDFFLTLTTDVLESVINDLCSVEDPDGLSEWLLTRDSAQPYECDGHKFMFIDYNTAAQDVAGYVIFRENDE